MSLRPRRHPEITDEMRRILQLLTQLRGGFGHGEAALLDRKLGRAEGYLGRVLRHDIHFREARAWKALEHREELLAIAASSMALIQPRRMRRVLVNLVTEFTRRTMAGELT